METRIRASQVLFDCEEGPASAPVQFHPDIPEPVPDAGAALPSLVMRCQVITASSALRHRRAARGAGCADSPAGDGVPHV